MYELRALRKPDKHIGVMAMKTLSNGRGFSLVELLTVIAIIGILAAIIFPVMNTVRERANQTRCMTNMHDIQVAIKLYKTDNRTFPEILGVQYQENTPFDRALPRDGIDLTIYMDQIKTAMGFRCPSSPVTDYTQDLTVYYPPEPHPDGTPSHARSLYAVDSYDAQTDASAVPVQARYTLRWAEYPGQVGSLSPYPPGMGDSDLLQEQDFERQLAFRNPPDNTVVTWCTYHKGNHALVLFLDGHVSRIDRGHVGQSLWRTRPTGT